MRGLKIKYVVDMVAHEHISGQTDKALALVEVKKKLPKNAIEFKIISSIEIEIKHKLQPKAQPQSDLTVELLKKMFGI